MPIVAASEILRAEQGFEQAALPLADKPAEPEDLALPDLDTDAAQRRARAGRSRRAPPRRSNEACRERRNSTASCPVISRTASSSETSAVSATETSSPFLRMATRLQKRTISSQRCEMKRTIAPAVAQVRDEIGEPGDFARSQRRGRFVQQEHARIALDGAHDLQHLLPPERKIADAWRPGRRRAMAQREDLLAPFARATGAD